MALIDKETIRNEIDKRYAEYSAKMETDDLTYYEGMADALDLFEQFLDTLEAEEKKLKPEICPRCAYYKYEMCYYPNGGLQTLHNENGIYECTGFDQLEAEEKDTFCKENCKGYQDAGRCFCDGGCEAKKKEKEVDLDKKLSGWMGHYAYENGGEYPSAIDIARHFYDLGCRHTAVMYDDIEHERQRAEEAEITKGMEDEIVRYLRDECSSDDEPSVSDIARHFAEWGAEHLNKKPNDL